MSQNFILFVFLTVLLPFWNPLSHFLLSKVFPPINIYNPMAHNWL